MKITRVEPILVALPYEHGGPKPMQANGPWATMDTLLVRVETDAGIVGWGDAFGFALSPITQTAVTRLVGPMAMGRDPTDIALLMGELRRRLQNTALNGPIGFALAGLDIALWDIKGKIEGKPIHALLGGGGKTHVPAYASLLRYGAADLVEYNAAAAVAKGYRRIKLHEIAEDTVAAGRRGAGPGVPLMIDINCAWDLDGALDMARRLKPHDPFWLEEPIGPPNDFDALANLRRQAGTPIAAGENLGNVTEARMMLDKGAVDIIQPSVAKLGGITETMKVIALARERGIRVAPHSPYFGPGLIATVHIIAALGGDMFVERFYCDLEASPLGDAINANGGQFAVPQGPGLGLEIDEKLIARYRVG